MCNGNVTDVSKGGEIRVIAFLAVKNSGRVDMSENTVSSPKVKRN